MALLPPMLMLFRLGFFMIMRRLACCEENAD